MHTPLQRKHPACVANHVPHVVVGKQSGTRQILALLTTQAGKQRLSPRARKPLGVNMENPVKAHGPMWRCLMVFDALLPAILIAAAPLAAGQSFQLPEAPSTHLNKKFLIAHSVLAASILFDGEVTHSHYLYSRGCYESSDWYGNPVTSWHAADGKVIKAYNFSRTRFYEINGGIFAAVASMDFLLQHPFHHVPVLRDLPYGLPVAFSVSHWHGGATWLTRGC